MLLTFSINSFCGPAQKSICINEVVNKNIELKNTKSILNKGSRSTLVSKCGFKPSFYFIKVGNLTELISLKGT